MTAAQVIEEIKQLPREEQERVFAFVSGSRREGASGVRRATDEQFEKAVDEVFKTHAGLLKRLAQ